MSLYLMAEVTVPASDAHALDGAVKELTVHSVQDHGCLQYHAFQKQDGFVFMEQWQDEAALKAHEATAHFQQFTQALERTQAELKIISLTKLTYCPD